MKNLIYLLLAMPLLFASCSNDYTSFEGEEVQVSFCAEIPVTRAAAALTVDTVVCAVFENGNEIDKLRKEISIEDGEDIVFAPRLIKGRTYNIVFWAMKGDSYNVTDLTKISRNDNATATEADYDAFTKSVEVTVNNSVSLPVTLTRPLAQLNVAISEADWNAAADLFGMTPTTTEIKVSKRTFCALCGEPEYTGQGEYTTYTLPASGNTVTVNGTDYMSIASCYVFATNESESHIIDITTVKDQNDNDIIRKDVTIPAVSIPAVTLQSNYKTNVVGSILTGKVSYTISISDTFANEEHKKEIE
ncbi:MAG: hypothetical protein IKV17_05535 [Bacteroidaceae bacterium]|nr:hypothetical protein [Bacteroidaceae bacterium]